VFAKVRERVCVSKQVAQKFDGERFNLKKLNELEVKKQYQISGEYKQVCSSGERK
jgi:hypothetical protein